MKHPHARSTHALEPSALDPAALDAPAFQPATDLRRVGACIRVAYRPGLLVAAWTSHPIEQAAVASATEFFLEWARAHRGGHAQIMLLNPAQPLPDSEARKALARELVRLEPILACATSIVLADGFAGAATRAIITAMQLVIRPPYPFRVTSSVEGAATWVRSRMRNLETPYIVDALAAAGAAATL